MIVYSVLFAQYPMRHRHITIREYAHTRVHIHTHARAHTYMIVLFLLKWQLYDNVSYSFSQ